MPLVSKLNFNKITLIYHIRVIVLNKIKLGIICGGVSTEHEASVNSFKCVINSIDKDKYGALIIRKRINFI